MTFTTILSNLTQITWYLHCLFLVHLMHLWGCNCFNHKYIAFWGQWITSPVAVEIIPIPPFSPLLVSVVWEFVFSICPWSECRQQKNGVEQTADAVDGGCERGPGCAPGAAYGSKGVGMCPLPAAADTGEAVQTPEKCAQLQQAQRHTLLQFSMEGLQCVHGDNVGLGKARKFSSENSVDWTLFNSYISKNVISKNTFCHNCYLFIFLLWQLKVSVVDIYIPNLLTEFVSSD